MHPRKYGFPFRSVSWQVAPALTILPWPSLKTAMASARNWKKTPKHHFLWDSNMVLLQTMVFHHKVTSGLNHISLQPPFKQKNVSNTEYFPELTVHHQICMNTYTFLDLLWPQKNLWQLLLQWDPSEWINWETQLFILVCSLDAPSGLGSHTTFVLHPFYGPKYA